MKLRIRIDHINSKHVHCTFFSDQFHKGTFADLGKLIMNIGEYQIFSAALLIAAEQMGKLLKVTLDPKFDEWAKREERKED